eukprot:SAG22_NODE_5770_length_955_cov_1.086449_1_plen_144_part_01
MRCYAGGVQLLRRRLLPQAFCNLRLLPAAAVATSRPAGARALTEYTFQDRGVVLDGGVDSNSPEFIANAAKAAAERGELDAVLGKIMRGGGERAVERHLSRGKLLPRERVDRLLDAGASPHRGRQPRQPRQPRPLLLRAAQAVS